MPLLTAVYFETLRRYPIWFAFPCRSTREFDYEGKRIRKGNLFALLTSRLDRHQIQALMPEVAFRRGHQGEVFVLQGDEADAFCIIEKGEFEVTLRMADGAEIFVRQLGPGDFFGEIGLLQNLPRTASVRVAAGCETR